MAYKTDRGVVFATPCLSHAVSLEFLKSALETDQLMATRMCRRSWSQRAGDCFVAKVRSKMVAEFLEIKKATDLFFIDDDIGWPAKKVWEFIERDEPILAGVYPKRSEDLDWPCSLAMNEHTGELIENDGLFRGALAPAGFMRIKRHVLEDLYERSPPFRDVEAGGLTKEYRAVFNSGPAADGWWWGEDYHFCNFANEHGYEIWIDPNIAFHHRGQKRYSGTLAGSLDQFRARALEAKKEVA